MRLVRAYAMKFGHVVTGRLFGQSRPCSLLPPASGDASRFHQFQAFRRIGQQNQHSSHQVTSILTFYLGTARTPVRQLAGQHCWSFMGELETGSLGVLPGRHCTRFKMIPALDAFETRRRLGSTVELTPKPTLTSAHVTPTANVASSSSDWDPRYGGDFPGSSIDGSGANHEQVSGSALDSVVKVFTVASSPNYWLPWQNKPQREMTGSGEWEIERERNEWVKWAGEMA